MTDTTTHKTLSDATYAMSLAKRVPDAELLDDFVRFYPQHAEALTEFAIDLAVDALQYGDEDFNLPADDETVSPMVARAMSKFQNRLFEMRGQRPTAPWSRASSLAVNPFAPFGRDDFRALASRVYANTAFVSKLRDRQIDFKTIPHRYVQHVAAEMPEELGVLTAHLSAVADVRQAQAQQPRQFYKAEGKPGTAQQQTFEEAVRSSGLTPERQSRLLAFQD